MCSKIFNYAVTFRYASINLVSQQIVFQREDVEPKNKILISTSPSTFPQNDRAALKILTFLLRNCDL